MKSFIERQHNSTANKVNRRPSPTKHACDMYSKKPEFNVTNQDLHQRAMKSEVQ